MTQTTTTADSPRAIRLEARPDGVGLVTFDVPGASQNTLRPDFGADLARVCDELERNPELRAAVLVSGKPDGFVAGADLDMLKGLTSVDAARQMVEAGHRALDRLAGLAKPVVAAIHGAALGGGFEIALACRARVLSSSKKTVLGFPEVRLGLLPGLNGLQRLAALAGLQVALDHGLTGKNMSPDKARRFGVAADVVPEPILVRVASELALALAEGAALSQPRKSPPPVERLKTLALEKNPLGRRVVFRQARAAVKKSTGGRYPAPGRILDVLETFAKKGFEASRAVEAEAFAELVTGDVSARLVGIFFATTALKKDTGVDDPSVAPREVRKVGVLGAGLMGAGIAYVSIDNGIAVRLKDRDAASVARGLRQVTTLLDERVKKKRLGQGERDQKLALLSGTSDYSGMRQADVVVEAVFEDLALKHRVLAEVEASCREDVIFASNTSSLPIGQIAARARRPENVVGMHYFSPVHKMPLLEVITTERTAPEVVATAVALGKRQGKTVIVVRDGVGFYTSRILGPYMNEAAWLLTEGCSVDGIDRALVAWGWPVGPLTLLDEVGIDVAAHVGPIMVGAFGERMQPPATVQKLVEDGRKGRKNDKGLYLYGAAAKELGRGKHVDATVYGVLGLPVPGRRHKEPYPVEEIQRRCVLQFVNEALHCHGEGVLRSARDGDIGAVFGLGFPPFLGGPFRYADTLGAATLLGQIEALAERHGKRWSPAPLLVEMAKGHRRFYG
ncbi:MAG: fatty acid oxidation complex subunit alpha FadJ [Myxococcales bacterium]|nr:fatty acid oxidation complex subunit alpha FadJ [Myxococcales bacterium]